MLTHIVKAIRKPTERQAIAGNYRKAHVRLHGLDITIENRKGTRRRPEWPPLAAHYGYIKRTTGADGDHVDVYLGPSSRSELVVVIDQKNQKGGFDEHKVMIGFGSEAAAVEAYRCCYTPGWKVGKVTTMTIKQFKNWLDDGSQSQPIADQVSQYAASGESPHRWITTETGSHILIDAKGVVQGGAGGKLNGKRLKPKGKASKPTEPAERSQESSPIVNKPRNPGRGIEPAKANFQQATLDRIKQHEAETPERERQEAEKQKAAESHPHHLSQLADGMKRALLDWHQQANALVKPVQMAGGAARMDGQDPQARMKDAWDGFSRPAPQSPEMAALRRQFGHAPVMDVEPGVDKSQVSALTSQLSDLLKSYKQQGINVAPFVKHNNLVPRELAAKLKPNDKLFAPVQDHERFMAEGNHLEATTEQYAARKAKNSPGQMGLFGDGLGGNKPLRKPETQMRWITIQGSHVMVDAKGTIVGGAGGKFNGKQVKPKAKTETESPASDVKAKAAAARAKIKAAGLEPFKPEAKEPERKTKAPRSPMLEGGPDSPENQDLTPEEAKEHEAKSNEAHQQRVRDLISKQQMPGIVHPDSMSRIEAAEAYLKDGGKPRYRGEDSEIEAGLKEIPTLEKRVHRTNEIVGRETDWLITPAEAKQHENTSDEPKKESTMQKGKRLHDETVDRFRGKDSSNAPAWVKKELDAEKAASTPAPGIQESTLSNADVKPGDQPALFEGEAKRAAKPKFEAKDMGGAKQAGMFGNLNVHPDQISMFDEAGAPEDRVYKPKATETAHQERVEASKKKVDEPAADKPKTYEQMKAEVSAIYEKHAKGTAENSKAYGEWLRGLKPEESREYIDRDSKDRRFARRSKSSKKGAATKERKASRESEIASDPAGSVLQKLRKEQDDLMKRWQVARDPADINKSLDAIAPKIQLASDHFRLRENHRLKDTQPHELRRNEERPKLGSDGNKQATQATRDFGIPWKVTGVGGSSYIVAGASLSNSVANQKTGVIHLKDANGTDAVRDGFLIHFDRGDQEKNKRARQLVWAIANGQAKDTTLEDLQRFVMGDDIDNHHPDYQKTPNAIGRKKAANKGTESYTASRSRHEAIIEYYAAKGAKNSPGQLGMFGDGLGGNKPLRNRETQTRWITVHPNGPGSHGTPVMINAAGKIIAGAGGSLNGKVLKPKSKESIGPAPKVSTASEKVSRSEPKVSHSEPKVSHSEPKVSHSEPKVSQPTYGDLVTTSDGKTGRMRGDNGMGGSRTGIIDENGDYQYVDREGLRHATAEEIAGREFPEQRRNKQEEERQKAEAANKKHTEDAAKRSKDAAKSMKAANDGIGELKGMVAGFDPEKHGGHKPMFDLANKINAGELSIDEFKAMHKMYRESGDAYKADLMKRYNAKQMTNIAGNLGNFGANRDGKQQNAKYIYDRLMAHAFDIGDGMSNSWSMDQLRDPDGKGKRLEEHVAKQTEESLAAHIEKESERTAERAKAKEADAESLANPQTLTDFARLEAKQGGYENMSAEHQAAYDELKADATRGKRDEQKKPTTVTADVSCDHGGFALTKNYHSKRGTDIYTASPQNRVDRDEYNKMNAAAKQLGGWYYKPFAGTPGGFHFPTEEAREKFTRAMAGESVDRSDILAAKQSNREQTVAEKLAAHADRLEGRGTEVHNADRKENTNRRAAMADSARARAATDIRQAKRLRSIAAAMDSGDVKHLRGVSALTQLEALQTTWRIADNKFQESQLQKKYGDNWRNQATYDEREKTYRHGETTPESIAHAKMPRQTIYTENVNGFLSKAASTPGLKQDAQRWQKRFAATGKDQFNLSTEASKEWFEFANKAKSKGVKHDWSGFTDKDNYQRLNAAGIHNDHELRAALREYAKHHNQNDGVSTVDPVAKLEKQIHLNHKEKGFFPTPPKAVDRALQLADIKDGQSVLEPSAGSGRIMDAIKATHGDSVTVKGVEQHSKLMDLLKLKGHDVDQGDFLSHKGSYDRIVMNPPFENDQAIDHVRHAFSLLKPGGKLVAIVPGSDSLYRDGSRNKRKEFASFVDEHGEFEQMAAGSFKGSDAPRETGVNSSYVVLTKPGSEEKTATEKYDAYLRHEYIVEHYRASEPETKNGHKIVTGNQGDRGYFVTINSNPVFVDAKSGTINRGPKEMRGKTIKSVPGKKLARSKRINTEARKGERDSPGQLGAFGNGLGGDMLRKPETQTKAKLTDTPERFKPKTKLDRLIADEVGHDPEDVAHFRDLYNDSHKMLSNEIRERNDALSQLLGNFGFGGSRIGMHQVLRKFKRAEEPGDIPRIDEMAMMARRDYPELLQAGIGQSDKAGDDEEALLNRFQTGFEKVPAADDERVLDLAKQMFDMHKSFGPMADIDMGDEWGEQSAPTYDDDFVPFAASFAESFIERYSASTNRYALITQMIAERFRQCELN